MDRKQIRDEMQETGGEWPELGQGSGIEKGAGMPELSDNAVETAPAELS
jgi:hypothetical protein